MKTKSFFPWLFSGLSLFPLDNGSNKSSEKDNREREEEDSWKRFTQVVHALFIRQLQVRLAGELSGLVWVVLQPLLMIILFTLMHTVIRGRSSSTYDIIVFMGSGIVPFFLFRTILQTSLSVFKSNKKLYIHPRIKPIDAFVANVILETSIYAIVTIVLLILAIVFGANVVPENFDWVVVGIIWLIVFGMSWGLFLGVINVFYPVVAKIISFFSFPLLILSAVFFPVSALPPIAREWIMYNPVAHFMELIHGAYIPSLDMRYVRFEYMLEWTMIPLFFGLWLYTKSERKYIAQ